MIAGHVIIKLDGNASGFVRTLANIQNKSVQFAARMKSVGNGLTVGVTAPLLLAGNQVRKFASDAEETRSKARAVFKDMSGEVEKWAQTHAKTIGRSSIDLLDYAANVQDTFVPLGFAREEASKMSRQVVELAEDLASFKNLRTDEVVEGLTSALVGNVENLRRYGVVANEAQIKQKALELGIIKTTKEALSPQQKALAIWKLTLEGTTDAQGDALRTAGSHANKLKTLQGRIKDLSATLGEQLLPALNTVVDGTISFVETINKLDPSVTGGLLALVGGLAAAGPIVRLFSTLGGVGTAIVAAGAAGFGLAGWLKEAAKEGNALTKTLANLNGWVWLIRLFDKGPWFNTREGEGVGNGNPSVGPPVTDFLAIQKVLAQNKKLAEDTAAAAGRIPNLRRITPQATSGVTFEGEAASRRGTLVMEKAIELAMYGKELANAFNDTLRRGEDVVFNLRDSGFDEEGALQALEKTERAKQSTSELGLAIKNEAVRWLNTFSDIGATAFANLITGARNLRDVFRDMGTSLKNLLGSLIGFFAKMALMKGLATLFPALTPILGVKAFGVFAKGGLVTKPTLGLLGEAGPEAVVPLSKMNQFRSSAAPAISGRLGVGIDELFFELDRFASLRGVTIGG